MTIKYYGDFFCHFYLWFGLTSVWIILFVFSRFGKSFAVTSLNKLCVYLEVTSSPSSALLILRILFDSSESLFCCLISPPCFWISLTRYWLFCPLWLLSSLDPELISLVFPSAYSSPLCVYWSFPPTGFWNLALAFQLFHGAKWLQDSSKVSLSCLFKHWIELDLSFFCHEAWSRCPLV